jgi:hypothetical protein
VATREPSGHPLVFLKNSNVLARLRICTLRHIGEEQLARKRKAASRKRAIKMRPMPPWRSESRRPARVATGKSSKRDLVLSMLNAPEGATIAAIAEATGWQAHSIRAFFARVVRKALQLNLASEKSAGGRIYRIASHASTNHSDG